MKPLVDAADLGNELCDPAQPFSASVAGKVVVCLRGGVDRVAKSLAVLEAGGAGMILYNPNDAQALVTDSHWVPSTHVNFTTGRPSRRTSTPPAPVRAPRSRRVSPGRPRVRSMADFSSRGSNPVAPDVIKPDVTAPGVNILAGNTPFPGAGAPGQLFQAISGTSMSSPHVAGLFALLRQAHPDWTAAMAKSAVMTTARQDVVKEDAATPADPFDMGAGHVDPSGKPSTAGSMFNPGLVYDADLFDYFAFLCGADTSVFIDPGSTCGQLEGAGQSTVPADLNLASIGASSIAGSTTVHRTVTSVADGRRTFAASVEAPAGFEVTVDTRQGEARSRSIGRHRDHHHELVGPDRRVGLRCAHVDEREVRGAQPDRGEGVALRGARQRGRRRGSTAASPSRSNSGSRVRTPRRRTDPYPPCP